MYKNIIAICLSWSIILSSLTPVSTVLAINPISIGNNNSNTSIQNSTQTPGVSNSNEGGISPSGLSSLPPLFSDFVQPEVDIFQQQNSNSRLPNANSSNQSSNPRSADGWTAAPQTSNDGKRSFTLEDQTQDFVQLFSGAGQYQVPINTPTGLKGLSPHLMLHYNSAAYKRNSFFGHGWDMEMGHIKRINKHGVDKMYSPDAVFDIRLPGLSGEMVKVAPGEYRLRTENAHHKMVFNTGQNSWEVTMNNGMIYKLGTTSNSRLSNTNGTKVFAWYIEEVSDLNGNTINYSYILLDGVLYPKEIRYGSNVSSSHPFSVRFEPFYSNNTSSSNRLDYRTEMSMGFARTYNHLIDKISIYSENTKRIEYRFTYFNESTVNRSLLKQIEIEGFGNNLGLENSNTQQTQFTYYSEFDGLDSSNIGFKRGMLYRVNNFQGGQVEYSYMPSKHMKNGTLPASFRPHFPVFVVDKLTLSDFTGRADTWSYLYQDGAFFSEAIDEKELAGFGRTTVTNPLNEKTLYYFHQGGGFNGTNYGENPKDNDRSLTGKWAFIGLLYRTEYYNNLSTIQQVNITQWETTPLPTLNNAERFFVAPQKTIFADLSRIRYSAKEYQYDVNTGNLLEEKEISDINWQSLYNYSVKTGALERSTVYEYAQNTSKNIISLPKTISLKKGNTVISSTKQYYDNLPHGNVSQGNITQKEDILLPSSGSNRSIFQSWTYNSKGQKISNTDALGYTTTTTYDSFGIYPESISNHLNQSIQMQYESFFGQVLSTTDPNGLIIENTYDTLGRLKRQSASKDNSQMEILRELVYQETQYPFSTVNIQYLNENNTADVYSYRDGFGRSLQVRSEIDLQSNGNTTYNVVNTTYDALNRPIFSNLAIEGNGSAYNSSDTSTLGVNTTYDYQGRVLTLEDTNGITSFDHLSLYPSEFENLIRNHHRFNELSALVTVQTDVMGNKKAFLYDGFQRLIGVIEREGGQNFLTEYYYDIRDLLVKIVDSQNNQRIFQYDSLGRLLSQSDLHRVNDTQYGTWQFEYDDNNNIIKTIDPRGIVIDSSYDVLNRITQQEVNASSNPSIAQISPSFSYRYDDPNADNSIGRLSEVSSNDYSMNYNYDLRGRVSSETTSIDNQSYTKSYEYTVFDQAKEIVYPDSHKLYTQFNSIGQIKSVLSDTDVLVEQLTYNTQQQVESIAYGNNVNSQMTYDPQQMYRLTGKQTRYNTPTVVQAAPPSPQNRSLWDTWLGYFWSHSGVQVAEASTGFNPIEILDLEYIIDRLNITLLRTEDEAKLSTTQSMLYRIKDNQGKTIISEGSIDINPLLKPKEKYSLEIPLINTKTGDLLLDPGNYQLSLALTSKYRIQTQWSKNTVFNVSAPPDKNSIEIFNTTGAKTQIDSPLRVAESSVQNGYEGRFAIRVQLDNNWSIDNSIQMQAKSGERVNLNPFEIIAPGVYQSILYWSIDANSITQRHQLDLAIIINNHKQGLQKTLQNHLVLEIEEDVRNDIAIPPITPIAPIILPPLDPVEEDDSGVYNDPGPPVSRIININADTFFLFQGDQEGDMGTINSPLNFRLEYRAAPNPDHNLLLSRQAVGYHIFLRKNSVAVNGFSYAEDDNQIDLATPLNLGDTSPVLTFDPAGILTDPDALYSLQVVLAFDDGSVTDVFNTVYFRVSTPLSGTSASISDPAPQLSILENTGAIPLASVVTVDAGTPLEFMVDVQDSLPLAQLHMEFTPPLPGTPPDDLNLPSFDFTHQTNNRQSVSFTPQPIQTGSYAVTIIAEDITGSRSTQTFTLEINSNTPPKPLDTNTETFLIFQGDQEGDIARINSPINFRLNYRASPNADQNLLLSRQATGYHIYLTENGQAINHYDFAHTANEIPLPSPISFAETSPVLSFDPTGVLNNPDAIYSLQAVLALDDGTVSAPLNTVYFQVSQPIAIGPTSGNNPAPQLSLLDTNGSTPLVGPVAVNSGNTLEFILDIQDNSPIASISMDFTPTLPGTPPPDFILPDFDYNHQTNNQQLFSFTPTLNQRGNYSLDISVEDSGGQSSSTQLSLDISGPPSPSTHLFQDLSYNYDAAGNIIQLNEAADTPGKKQVNYSYDDLYRLKTTNAIVPSNTSGTPLPSDNFSDYTRSLDYDSVGNITQKSDQGSYTYLGHNEGNPQAVKTITASNGNTQEFNYDLNGNMVSHRFTDNTVTPPAVTLKQYQWDAYNRLFQATVTLPDGSQSVSTYNYDYDGRRLKQSVNSGTSTTTRLYPFPDYEITPNLNAKTSVSAANMSVATIEVDTASGNPHINKTLFFFHSDHLGGANIISDTQGHFVQALDYFPFGSLRLDEQYQNFDERLKFTGHELDDQTQLYYAQARYYNSHIGRFISQDPLQYRPQELLQRFSHLPQALNHYSYVINNPLVLLDPTGEFWTLQEIDHALATGEHALLFVGDSVTFGFWSEAVNDAKTAGERIASEGLNWNTGLNAAGEVAQGSAKVVGSAFTVGATAGKVNKVVKGLKNTKRAIEYAEKSRTKKLQPDPNATGPHSTFKRNNKGNTSGYTTFDKNGFPRKRVRLEGKPHGGIEPPIRYEYAPPNTSHNGKIYPGKELKGKPADLGEVPKVNF